MSSVRQPLPESDVNEPQWRKRRSLVHTHLLFHRVTLIDICTVSWGSSKKKNLPRKTTSLDKHEQFPCWFRGVFPKSSNCAMVAICFLTNIVQRFSFSWNQWSFLNFQQWSNINSFRTIGRLFQQSMFSLLYGRGHITHFLKKYRISKSENKQRRSRNKQ